MSNENEKNVVEAKTMSDQEILAQFCAPISDVPDAFSGEQVPYRHLLPTADDPSISLPPWSELFNADLFLTNAQEGLRRNKTNQNISEIVDAISNRYELATVSNQLAVYQPPHWKIMSKDEALRFITEVVDKLFGQDAKFLSNRQYKEIVSQLQHHPNTSSFPCIPSPDSTYLCCLDYMFDWRNHRCLPHDSSFLRFYHLNLNAADIGNCTGTYWEMLLASLTGGEPALRQRILEMIGVIVSGYPSKTFFFLEGASGTGKSQLVNFLRGILGNNACFALRDIAQLGDEWTTGSIAGKLLCLCGDMPHTTLQSKVIGTIKQLTGDDSIWASIKFKDAFNFENTAKLLFVSNYPLQLPNQYQEQALLERLVVIPCQNSVPREQQIPKLHEYLLQEAGYIINLAMDALNDFCDRNGVFTPLPETLLLGTVQASDNEQDIIDFVQDCCVLAEEASTSVANIFSAFQQYTPESSLKNSSFSKLLCNIYPQIQRHRVGQVRKYLGIRLKSTLD